MSKPVDQWMPLHIAAYLVDTQHLTTEQHGAYVLLLMHCWTHEGRLPDDDGALASICRMTPLQFRRKIAGAIRPFLQPAGDGHLTQKRLMEERQKAVVNHNQKSLAARAKNRKLSALETVNENIKILGQEFNEINGPGLAAAPEPHPSRALAATPPIPIPIEEEDSISKKDSKEERKQDSTEQVFTVGQLEIQLAQTEQEPPPADPVSEAPSQPEAPTAAMPSRYHTMPRLSDKPHVWLGSGLGIDRKTGKPLVTLDENGVPHLVVAGPMPGGIRTSMERAARAVCNAAKVGNPHHRWDWNVLADWLALGFTPDVHIIPAIKQVAAQPSYRSVPLTLRYFDAAIRNYARLHEDEAA